jgi:hypothetical protein
MKIYKHTSISKLARLKKMVLTSKQISGHKFYRAAVGVQHSIVIAMD